MTGKEQTKELYTKLKESAFAFIPLGRRHIEEVYELVKAQYPDLCDDDLKCSDCCSSGNKTQPEWKHRVRTALAHGYGGQKDPQRGFWIFE